MDLTFYPSGPQKDAPRYSLRAPAARRHHTSKLHVMDIREIRAWVTREGFGIPIGMQIALLQVTYPLGESTIRDVILNRTWADVTYDRTVPDPTYAAETAAASVSRGFWILTWLRLWMLAR